MTIDPRQRQTDHLEAVQTAHDGRQSQIHTAMPAKVVSYNPGQHTVNVQPMVQGLRTGSDGKVNPVTIAELHDVPVIYPGGGHQLITYPIAVGDECLIIFAERSIDHWWQLGTLNPPSDWRMHDINDGFALMGIRSLPNVPGGGAAGGTANAGAAISTSTMQIRSNDGHMVIELDPATNTIRIAAAGNVEITAGLDLKMQAPYGSIKLYSPNIEMNPAS
jgi:hypothetical protein